LPYVYDISEALCRIQVTARGKVDFASALVLAAAISKDDRFRSHYSLFVDLRRMDFIPNTREVHKFALSVSQLKTEYTGPIAVISQPGFIFGIVRMTCLIAGTNGFPMGAFDDEAEAEQWLSDPPEAASASRFF
jgi:hypothetical protein